MKKTITMLMISTLVLAAMPLTAFAHGHKSGNRYALCAVESCNATGGHRHNSVAYAGHYIGDGHDYHQICSAEDCVIAGSHNHDGETYMPHNNADGHNYHSSGHRSVGHH